MKTLLMLSILLISHRAVSEEESIANIRGSRILQATPAPSSSLYPSDSPTESPTVTDAPTESFLNKDAPLTPEPSESLGPTSTPTESPTTSDTDTPTIFVDPLVLPQNDPVTQCRSDCDCDAGYECECVETDSDGDDDDEELEIRRLNQNSMRQRGEQEMKNNLNTLEEGDEILNYKYEHFEMAEGNEDKRSLKERKRERSIKVNRNDSRVKKEFRIKKSKSSKSDPEPEPFVPQLPNIVPLPQERQCKARRKRCKRSKVATCILK